METSSDSFLMQHAENILAEGNGLLSRCRSKKNKKKSNYRLILSASFARAIEMSHTLIVLLQNSRTPDSGVILRSIFNLFVSVAFLKEKRAERSLTFMLDGTERHINILKKLIGRIGQNNRVHQIQLAFEEKQKEGIINELIKIDPSFKRWKCMNIYDKACTWPAIKEYYLLYSELSRYEHNDYSALCAYVDVKTCNPILRPTSHFCAPEMTPDNLLILWLPIICEFLDFFNEEYKLGRNTIISDLNKKSLSFVIC